MTVPVLQPQTLDVCMHAHADTHTHTYSHTHTQSHGHTHTDTQSDGMLYRPITCGIIGVEVLIYVLRFNMNITLTP